MRPRSAESQALARVSTLFQREADTLTPFGARCLVRASGTALDVRVDRQGQPVCGLRLYFSDTFRDDRLLMAFQWPRVTGNSYNGWVTAQWDGDAARPVLQFTDMALGTATPAMVTADELFHLLWGKVIDHLEHVR